MPGKNKRKKRAKRKKQLAERKATAPIKRKDRCYKWSADGTRLFELHPLTNRIIRVVPPEHARKLGGDSRPPVAPPAAKP